MGRILGNITEGEEEEDVCAGTRKSGRRAVGAKYRSRSRRGWEDVEIDLRQKLYRDYSNYSNIRRCPPKASPDSSMSS